MSALTGGVVGECCIVITVVDNISTVGVGGVTGTCVTSSSVDVVSTPLLGYSSEEAERVGVRNRRSLDSVDWYIVGSASDGGRDTGEVGRGSACGGGSNKRRADGGGENAKGDDGATHAWL